MSIAKNTLIVFVLFLGIPTALAVVLLKLETGVLLYYTLLGICRAVLNDYYPVFFGKVLYWVVCFIATMALYMTLLRGFRFEVKK